MLGSAADSLQSGYILGYLGRYDSDAVYRKIFDLAVSVAKGEEEATFRKRNQVVDSEQRGHMIFMDFALLTEGELDCLASDRARHVKHQLTLQSVQNQLGTNQQLYLMSLAGLSDAQANGLRKFRVFTSVFLSLHDMLLEGERQLHEGQGRLMFDYNHERLQKQLPTGLKEGSARAVKSLEELLACNDASRLAGVVDLDEMPSAVVASRAETAAVKAAPKTKQATRKRGKAPAGGGDDTFSVAGRSTKSGRSAGAGGASKKAKTEMVKMEPQQSLDTLDLAPEFRRVCHAMAGKVPECFIGLSIERILQGEKLGCKVNGVPGSVAQCWRQAGPAQFRIRRCSSNPKCSRM